MHIFQQFELFISSHMKILWHKLARRKCFVERLIPAEPTWVLHTSTCLENRPPFEDCWCCLLQPFGRPGLQITEICTEQTCTYIVNVLVSAAHKPGRAHAEQLTGSQRVKDAGLQQLKRLKVFGIWKLWQSFTAKSHQTWYAEHLRYAEDFFLHLSAEPTLLHSGCWSGQCYITGGKRKGSFPPGDLQTRHHCWKIITKYQAWREIVNESFISTWSPEAACC